MISYVCVLFLLFFSLISMYIILKQAIIDMSMKMIKYVFFKINFNKDKKQIICICVCDNQPTIFYIVLFDMSISWCCSYMSNERNNEWMNEQISFSFLFRLLVDERRYSLSFVLWINIKTIKANWRSMHAHIWEEKKRKEEKKRMLVSFNRCPPFEGCRIIHISFDN